MHRRTKAESAVLCLASLLLFPSVFQIMILTQSKNTDLLKYEVVDAFVGSIRHSIQINNPTWEAVSSAKFVVPLIRNVTARHYAILYNISSSIDYLSITNDSNGNFYAYWDNVHIKAKGKFSVVLDYNVLSFGTRYLIDSSVMLEYNKSSLLYREYTQPEPLIQSDDPNIVSEALDVTGNSASVPEKVSRIFSFTRNHLTYEAQNEEKGALWALEHGTGDCSEYSYLFVALCRAIGVPSRVQAGFAFHSTSETIEDGHMWAEYYLEEYGWVPADVTWGNLNSLDSRHFSSIQGIPEAIPYSNYFFNTTQDLELEDNQTITLGPSHPSAFDNGSFAEEVVKAIQQVESAKTVLLVGRMLGAALIFSSETQTASRTLHESEILLQNAVERRDLIGLAHSFAEAREAALHAWTSVAKVLSIYVGILVITLIVALIIRKQHHLPNRSSLKASENQFQQIHDT